MHVSKNLACFYTPYNEPPISLHGDLVVFGSRTHIGGLLKLLFIRGCISLNFTIILFIFEVSLLISQTSMHKRQLFFYELN